MKFCSPEYLKLLQKKTNENKEYLKLAKDENDSYTLVLEQDKKWNVKERIIVGFEIKKGKTTDIWSGTKKTTYVISAPYGIWVDILQGKTDLNSAFIDQKLKVRGDLQGLISHLSATLKWIDILRKIPTEF